MHNIETFRFLTQKIERLCEGIYVNWDKRPSAEKYFKVNLLLLLILCLNPQDIFSLTPEYKSIRRVSIYGFRRKLFSRKNKMVELKKYLPAAILKTKKSYFSLFLNVPLLIQTKTGFNPTSPKIKEVRRFLGGQRM